MILLGVNFFLSLGKVKNMKKSGKMQSLDGQQQTASIFIIQAFALPVP